MTSFLVNTAAVTSLECSLAFVLPVAFVVAFVSPFDFVLPIDFILPDDFILPAKFGFLVELTAADFLEGGWRQGRFLENAQDGGKGSLVLKQSLGLFDPTFT